MVITARMLLSAFVIITTGLFFTANIFVKGRDDMIKEELYQGTCKGAEGYAARLTFKKAKDEGMNIAIQLITVTSDVTICRELENCSQNITQRGGR